MHCFRVLCTGTLNRSRHLDHPASRATCSTSCCPSKGSATAATMKLFTTCTGDYLNKNILPACSLLELQSQFIHVVLPGDAAAHSSVADLCDAHTAAAAIITPGPQQQQSVEQLRNSNRSLFIICWHPAATEDAEMRWAAFQAGANMVTHCQLAVAAALQQVAGNRSSGGITCEWCGLPGLSPSEYWQHQPLYHINEGNKQGICQICSRFTHNLAVHVHHHHHPANKPEAERTGVYSICIIRRPSDGSFLMPQEFAGAGFWLPGGGVDRGETLTAAAHRECWEEAGVEIELKGLLAAQGKPGQWRKIVFYGEPAAAYARQHTSSSIAGTGAAAAATVTTAAASSAAGRSCAALPAEAVRSACSSSIVTGGVGIRCTCGAPKTLPDFESAGACWVHAAQLPRLVLRSTSDLEWMATLGDGGPGTEGLLRQDGQQRQAPAIRKLQLCEEWVQLFEGFPLE